MDANFLYGIITSAGGGGVIWGLIQWGRNLKKDKAVAGKTDAEAFSIKQNTLTGGYQQLIQALNQIRTDERKQFQEMMDAERKECDLKIGELKLHYEQSISALQMQIHQLKNAMNKKTNTE
jgi:ABC-type phosphate transport system auxiliary subunit